ncbi:MAG: response regulator transcription factor [Sulfurovum sp.]|nr:response regulator transcription factor [Sulfurovum sp.]
MKIMLIEDDMDMQELLKDYLINYDYEVVAFDKPVWALNELQKDSNYSLVILDLMLPQIDGFDVCKKIRERSDIPIIISSARGGIGDKVVAYDYGADDYLSKPYEPKELVMKINAILRRLSNNISRKVIGEFEIDEKSMQIYQDGEPIELTQAEYRILLFLIDNRDKVVSRTTIANHLGESYSSDRAIDMHISNIRNKIFDDPKQSRYIKSVWGVGYKFIG